MSEERLQKILARAGITSRRKAEALITAGRVAVDGKIVTELGSRADPKRQKVELDGRRLVAEQLVYLVLHKPRGVVSTLSDPEGRPTVAALVRDVPARVVPVGRLDFHTSGVLLLTNDGEFASQLSHPKLGVPKVYVAKVRGLVQDADLERFGESIEIDGRATRPADVRRLRFEGDKTWLEITLKEGRNRQVRRLGEATGFPVMRLSRLTHAGVTGAGLRPGQWRYLTAEELQDLRKAWGVPRRVRAGQIPVGPPVKEQPLWRNKRRAEEPAARRPSRSKAESRKGRTPDVAHPSRRATEARPQKSSRAKSTTVSRQPAEPRQRRPVEPRSATNRRRSTPQR